MGTRGRGCRSNRGGRAQASNTNRSDSSEVPPLFEPPEITDPHIEDNLLSPNSSSYDPPAQNYEKGQSNHGQNSSNEQNCGDSVENHDPNTDDDHLIRPFYNGFLPTKTTRRVMDILRKYMGPWPTWLQVPEASKDFLYGKFKENFYWLPEHEAGIRFSWEHTHKMNFKMVIYRNKQQAIKVVGRDDPREIQKVVPKNMLSSDWKDICNGHMSASNYQDRCKKARENRMIEKDGSITKHTGGSIPFAEHKRRMSKNGEEARQVDVHERTHRRAQGKGPYVDKKSKRVREEYDKKVSSQLGGDPTAGSSFDPRI